MVKIEAKIKYYGLECVCNLYDYAKGNTYATLTEIEATKNYKAALNIVELLVIKFKKKLLTKDPNCKPIKISLEYNQAYFLVNFIYANIDFYHGILEKTLLNTFAQKLNQQL